MFLHAFAHADYASLIKQTRLGFAMFANWSVRVAGSAGRESMLLRLRSRLPPHSLILENFLETLSFKQLQQSQCRFQKPRWWSQPQIVPRLSSHSAGTDCAESWAPVSDRLTLPGTVFGR